MRPALNTTIVLGALGLALACEACSPREEEAQAGTRSPSIVNGAVDTGHPEVGLLQTTTGTCTATVISPRAILTAAHCVWDKAAGSFKEGPGAAFVPTLAGSARPDAASAVEVYHLTPHPDAAEAMRGYFLKQLTINEGDVAVGFLAREVEITPAALTASAPVAWDRLTLVGFGLTAEKANDLGTRRVASNDISFPWDIQDHLFKYRGSWWNEGTICSGDSGGPSYHQRDGRAYLVGVHSWSTCEATTVDSAIAGDMRVDVYRDWVTSQVASPPPPPLPVVTFTSPQPAATQALPPSFAVQAAVVSSYPVSELAVTLDGASRGATPLVADPLDSTRRTAAVALAGLAPGSHALRLTATDRAGLSGEAELVFKVALPPDAGAGPSAPDAGPSEAGPARPDLIPAAPELGAWPPLPAAPAPTPAPGALDGGCVLAAGERPAVSPSWGALLLALVAWSLARVRRRR